MTTSKLPSLIGIRSILKGWFNKAWQVTVTGNRLLPVAGPLFLQFLSAFLTQGTISSIPIIFSWGGSISPEGFLPSVLLWLVIIIAAGGVGVTVVVVIIIAVVIVVESSSVIKLSFVITLILCLEQSPDENFHYFLRIWHHGGTQGFQFLEYFHICWAKEFHQDRASSVNVPVANFTLQSSVQLLQENADSVLSN
ncbi:hypothetical protein Tco_0655960 [Tanacetum coccineum]|uniref:Uncharacterized protein n=1 Tax=Tanacetum coccineum TaxID=301880 RepID=A0ABQ4X7K6_9ASTR